ncbi:MAG TPA: methyl-accepting chemotaxis protein [Gemmatimonadales bacterium]|nr:methyl-accepting chemotaxis protein [Gemmatimonadales bacterium]
MAEQRRRFVRSIYLASAGLLALLGALEVGVFWLLGADSFPPGRFWLVAAAALGAYLVLAALIIIFTVSWLRRNILRPLGNTIVVATRVAEGDLTVSLSSAGAGDANSMTQAVGLMVSQLRTLVAAIRTSAQEAAAMAQEISSSTQQMSASTEEVSGTCNDLTDRATKQAAVVRAAAQDGDRILQIAQTLATSAGEAADRNAALARLARDHRDELDASSSELQRLAEEIEKGAEEAAALATASEEIEKFVTQTKAIARQTHMLALNAGIEAARAGEEGKGFAVVAEEVRKLAGQAAQAATQTSETVQMVQERVATARDRLLRLARGGQAARATAHKAAEGLARVADEAHQTDEWGRQISKSSGEVRTLIEGIALRMTEVSSGTEDVAAAAEEIAASAQELSASTEQVAGSAHALSEAATGLFSRVGKFKLE